MRPTLIVIVVLLASSTSSIAQESTDAQNWLRKAIEKYFAEFPLKPLNEITTEKYADYKQDAICVVYDCENSLTEEQFEQKWGNIYDITFAGLGVGFLIDQQDWDKIIVTKCELIEQPKKGTYIFKTEVTDTGFGLTHMNEITVVQTAQGFKIDDVKNRK